jgi:hypothetical protein
MRLFVFAALSTLGLGAMGAEPAAPQPKVTPDAGPPKINMAQLPRHLISPAAATCYFIRSLRPITQEDLAAAPAPSEDAAKPAAPRLIPLQARVAGVVNQPVCAQAGQTTHAVYDASARRN